MDGENGAGGCEPGQLCPLLQAEAADEKAQGEPRQDTRGEQCMVFIYSTLASPGSWRRGRRQLYHDI